MSNNIGDDPITNLEFWDRYSKATVTELFVQQLKIVTGSSLTQDGVDNYPCLVFVIQKPPDYPKNTPELFFVLPLSDRTVGEDGQPVMSEIKSNSIIVAARDLFNTVYGPDDSREVSNEGLTSTE